MRLAFVALFALVLAAKSAEEPSPKPGVHSANSKELVLFTLKSHPEERLALLFTAFKDGTATYKWMYFNPQTSDWVTGASKVQEVYDKIPVGEGLNVTAVPGHNTTIKAGRISIEWSRGSKNACWLYFRPEHLTMQTLPADQFYKLE